MKRIVTVVMIPLSNQRRSNRNLRSNRIVMRKMRKKKKRRVRMTMKRRRKIVEMRNSRDYTVGMIIERDRQT